MAVARADLSQRGVSVIEDVPVLVSDSIFTVQWGGGLTAPWSGDGGGQDQKWELKYMKINE